MKVLIGVDPHKASVAGASDLVECASFLQKLEKAWDPSVGTWRGGWWRPASSGASGAPWRSQ